MELSRLQSRITEQGLEWQAADTALSALAAEEKAKRLGAVPPSGTPSLAERESAAAARQHVESAVVGPSAAGPALPGSVDWRSKDGLHWVTPIEDQAYCGSCVAFGCVGAFEALVRIDADDANRAVDLSEADLWFCYGPNHFAGPCPGGGWWVDDALPGLVQGIVDAACFPYSDADQPCHRCADSASRLTKITGWHTLFNTADMKSFLATTGPLVTCFSVYDDFYSYLNGVYAPSNDPSNNYVGGHCVCVVGYDDGNQCWICKNSWGAAFGENGFFRIKYGACGIDWEMWAIEGVESTGWSPWVGLGGLLTSDPSLGSNADGRQELFARGANNVPYHLWQLGPNGPWSGWASLGGAVTGNIGVGRNTDGRLEVFARGTNNALFHSWQVRRNGPWTAWASLGGSLTSDPIVASSADGRLEVFARGTDNALHHRRQDAPNGAWSGGWASLGGLMTGNIGVGRNADGRLELFARGIDNALHHAWQTAPNGGWSGWTSLGGVVTGNLAVGRNADGRLEVLARGADNALHHAWQTAPNGGWSGWASLGNVLTSDPVVASNAGGRLEVFARGADNALHHAWQTAPNGGWSGWASLGGVVTGNIGVGRNADGRLEVFARAIDNSLYHAWQLQPS